MYHKSLSDRYLAASQHLRLCNVQYGTFLRWNLDLITERLNSISKHFTASGTKKTLPPPPSKTFKEGRILRMILGSE